MVSQTFHTYADKIIEKYSIGTEYTPRTPLENLLNDIKPENEIQIVHEAKSTGQINGRPDFKIQKNKLIVGHIETKPAGKDLDKIIEGKGDPREVEQLKNYLDVSQNLILTNYSNFILFKHGEEVDRIQLFPPDMSALKEDSIEDAVELMEAFFLTDPMQVTKPRNLAVLLAERTKIFDDLLKEFIDETGESSFKNQIVGDRGLYSLYQDTLIEDLELEDFIDTYVQTVTFGLLLARLDSEEELSIEAAVDNIPDTAGILDDLFETLQVDDIPSGISWIIDEILYILNNTDIDEINDKLSFEQSYDYEDPYVYFYENFLSEYDQELRIKRGVFYTPLPVVRFITDGLDSILKDTFESSGFRDSNVTTLDFAVGTGTFLLEAFKSAIEETDTGLVDLLITQHLLENFYGFEFMIAPYTICHLKIAQYLENEDFEMGAEDRLNVYLTNTLDNTRHDEWGMFPHISEEGREANEVKLEKTILAIMGNPPYSIHSENRSRWIQELIGDYKEGLEEKKVNLDDDYIKFLRYAQWKINRDGKGVIGVVTNNSFVDGITHREMRRSLIEDFDEIYVLNLHGNQSRGDPGENVFDIRNVGISITFLVKHESSKSGIELNYVSAIDEGFTTREEKYEYLIENSIDSIEWESLQPSDPYYWFVNKEFDFEDEYEQGWSIEDIFDVTGSGIVTERDPLFIDFEKDRLSDRMETLMSGEYDEEFEENYRIVNTSSYPLKDRLEDESFDDEYIRRIHYRPFDYRYIYYKKGFTSRPGYKIMKNLMDGDNLALVSVRQVAERTGFNHLFVTNELTDHRITTSNRGHAFFFPMYLDEEPDNQRELPNSDGDGINQVDVFGSLEKKVNYSDEFLKFIEMKYDFEVTPETIFHYIYGVLSSPSYREKFQEYLKVDYPKVVFVDDEDTFTEVSKLGHSLIQLHTFNKSVDSDEICTVPEHNDFSIGDVRFEESEERVYINENQYFENVPARLWEFELCGYQIIEKWLEEKQGRVLTLNDIEDFQRIVRIMDQTISIMNKMDEVLPPAFR